MMMGHGAWCVEEKVAEFSHSWQKYLHLETYDPQQ